MLRPTRRNAPLDLGSPSVLRQKNARSKADQAERDRRAGSGLKEKDNGEGRKRTAHKTPASMSPGSVENNPNADGPEASPKKLRLEAGPSTSTTLVPLAVSYVEEVVQFSEDDANDQEDNDSEVANLKVLTRAAGRSRSGKSARDASTSFPRAKKRRTEGEESPDQKAKRKSWKKQEAASRREARRSIKELEEKSRVMDKAPQPNKALLYFQERTLAKAQSQPCSGIIKRIRLFNFMCHESFEKDWHPNLNFITGENGSGKSAVLSGILVGLGARAASTSRTKSIKGLVKTGKEFCKIEITLANYGLLSDKYGREILIQRVIDKNGQSTYKIDDGKSRMRPLRKNELDIILVTLNIMLDNPVAVLNQETARSFLRSKDPKDKYKLFYEGTTLGKCQRVLAESEDNLAATKQNFLRARELMDNQKEEVKNLEKAMKKFNDLDRMVKQIDVLSAEYHWALVIADEKKRDKMQDEVDRDATLRNKLQAALDGLTERKAELLQASKPSPEREEELKSELREQGRLDKDAQLEITTLSRVLADAKGKIRGAANQTATYKKTIATLAETIEKLQTSGAEEAENAKREYEEKQEEFLKEKTEAEQEVSTLKHDSEQFKHGADSLKEELNELEDKDRNLARVSDRSKKEYMSLKNNSKSKSKYEPYGRNIETLVAKIQAYQHRFRKQPRGPLGACFTVKNEKWVKLIEFVLSNDLTTFVVDNNEDKTLIMELIKETYNTNTRDSLAVEGKRPTILVQSFGSKAFDVSQKKAAVPNHPTILDAIEIEDDFIAYNALIDQCRIERILLVETNKEALELLKDYNAPGFPKTCLYAFTLENYKVTPDPRYRVDPLRRGNRQASYLKCSSQAQLRSLQKQIVEIQQERQELAPTLVAKRNEEAEYREKYQGLVRVLRAAHQKLQGVRVKLSTLAKTVVKSPDITSFNEELNETNQLLATLLENEAEAKRRYSETMPKITALKAQREEIAIQVAALQQEVEDFRDKTDKVQAKVDKIDQSFRKLKAQLRDAEVKFQIVAPKLAKYEELVRTRIIEAEKHGERVDTQRSPESLHQQFKEYSTQIEEAKKSSGDRDVVARNLKLANKKFNTTKTEYLVWYNIFSLIGHSLNTNSNYFDINVRSFGQVLTACFQALIGARQYEGRLIIDDGTEELYYFVCPDGESDAKTKAALASNNDKIIKNYLIEYASGLSGGERSFATICFIIAMWQVMECPFFMLDEFDVFMDPINRKTSQNALMSHALTFKAHQFFLFTPLDLTQMPEPGEATVLRMFPPVRTAGGGATLDEEDLEDDVESQAPSTSRQAPRRRR